MECTAEHPWPLNIHLDSCSTTSHNGKGDPPLEIHIDWRELGGGGLGGWVVVLSLGASAEFCFSESIPHSDKTPDDWEKVVVHSGDVLVIEGSRVCHGPLLPVGPWNIPSRSPFKCAITGLMPWDGVIRA